MSSKPDKPFTFRFIDVGETVRLELTNATDQPLESVEVLTVFLKDEETPGGGPSQAHIKFETVKRIAPRQGSILSHRTWINGKPGAVEQDQLKRLQVSAGAGNPYALDVSWQNPEGRTRFQRIPLGQ
jgi:hypothetical protein